MRMVCTPKWPIWWRARQHAVRSSSSRLAEHPHGAAREDHLLRQGVPASREDVLEASDRAAGQSMATNRPSMSTDLTTDACAASVARAAGVNQQP